MIMEEVWKSLSGFDDRYFVSNMGRIKSVAKGKDVFLKYSNSTGLSRVTLHYRCGGQKTFLVHRLVLGTFEQTEYPNIIHINGDRLDNRLTNLKGVSHSDVMKEKYKNGRGTTNHPWKKKIEVYFGENKIGDFDSIAEMCKVMELKRHSVRAVLKGEYKQHHGFTFKIV